MTDNYAQAQELITEALEEIEPSEKQLNTGAAIASATLALVDVLAAWRAEIDSEPSHHPTLQLCEAQRRDGISHYCSLPAGHVGEHQQQAVLHSWPQGGA